jgi:acyl dehydratase
MEGLAIGQSVEVKRIFTRQDLFEYAELIGRTAGSQSSESSEAGAQPRIPGPLLGGMISYLLGTKLPGPGTMWLKQRFSYETPALAGEELTARVVITHLRPEKSLVYLQAMCVNSSGKVVCQGETLVMYQKTGA